MAQGIAATRQYIWGQAQDVEYVCQVSDDLRFAWRDPYLKLHGATELHLCDIFDRIYTLLDEGWMHVGLSARGGNNHVDVPVKVIGRMCDVYAHRHHDCKRLKVRFDRVPVMEDFDVTLQLLELGHPNAIIYDYCWDQNSSNSDGGCSLYRTPELQAEGAQGLTRLHPSFVSTVERSSNNWKGFPGTRLDVRVQWQRAYDAWGKRPGAKPGQVLTGMGSGLRRSVMGRKPKLVKKSLPGDSGNYTATPDIMTAPKKVIVRKKKKILRKKPRDPDQGDMF
jgi:hypothetical protein